MLRSTYSSYCAIKLLSTHMNNVKINLTSIIMERIQNGLSTEGSVVQALCESEQYMCLKVTEGHRPFRCCCADTSNHFGLKSLL